MFRVFIIVLIIFVVLLFPIPIKISLKYINRELYINIYRKKINIKKHDKKQINKIFKKDKKEKKEKKYPSFNSKQINLLIEKLMKSKLKPRLKLRIKLNYGLDDAAKTAICYGYLCTLASMLFNISNLFFNVDKKDFQINPFFNKVHFNLEINSIIFINLANIIYIVIVFLKIFFITKRKKISATNISKEEM